MLARSSTSRRDQSVFPKASAHTRRTLRLKEFDYPQSGAYFVTVCTKERECLFGEIVDEKMVLNETGRLVLCTWLDLPTRFSPVELDSFVIMPNHVHGILFLVGAGLALPEKGAASGAPTLADIVRAFKSLTSIQVNRILSRIGQPLWQRNYFERVVRNDEELYRIREYIENNPHRWELDRENPAVNRRTSGVGELRETPRRSDEITHMLEVAQA